MSTVPNIFQGIVSERAFLIICSLDWSFIIHRILIDNPVKYVNSKINYSVSFIRYVFRIIFHI